jgi:hypothetical protein
VHRTVCGCVEENGDSVSEGSKWLDENLEVYGKAVNG